MTTMENLFPGMEAFMEGDVEVEVNVGAPAPEEVVEEAETAADEQAEVVEATDEAEDVAEQAEEMFARFDEVDRMIAHVQTYGVDRSFLSLMNYNDRLSKTFGIQLPACESFDAVGSPRSAESIACSEGLKEIAGKVWAFIKRVCAKIAGVAARIFEAVRVRLGSIDGNIGRLRKALEKRADKPADAIKDVKVKVVDTAALEKYAKDVDAAADKVTANSGVFSQLFTQIQNGVVKDEKLDTTIKAFDEAMKNVSKPKTEETDVKNASSRAAAYLDRAAKERLRLEGLVKVMNEFQAAAKSGVKLAQAAEARRDANSEDAGKGAKKVANTLNRAVSVASNVVSAKNWIASACVKAASQLVVRGTEKK